MMDTFPTERAVAIQVSNPRQCMERLATVHAKALVVVNFVFEPNRFNSDDANHMLEWVRTVVCIVIHGVVGVFVLLAIVI